MTPTFIEETTIENAHMVDAPSQVTTSHSPLIQ